MIAEQAAAVALCARAEATWHQLGLAALGVPWHDDGRLAWAGGPASPVFLSAVTLAPRAVPVGQPPPLGVRAGTLRDSFADLELAGWQPEPADPWMLRSPGAVQPAPVPGLHIAPADTDAEVAVFERTAFLGATGVPDPLPAGSVHPPGSAHVAGLHLLLARLAGEPVGTALAAVGPGVVCVSGVNVLAAARRRGIGRALTAAALGVAPHLYAALSASELGYQMYARLGFVEVGRPLHWTSAG